MSFLIAHRGNTEGPNPDLENSLPYLEKAISEGFRVEADIWRVDSITYFGHDYPQYEVDSSWISENAAYLWLHCKNLEAIIYCQSFVKSLEYFWHETDKYTITSGGNIWVFPGNPVPKEWGILVDKELKDIPTGTPRWICSDYVKLIKQRYRETRTWKC